MFFSLKLSCGILVLILLDEGLNVDDTDANASPISCLL